MKTNMKRTAPGIALTLVLLLGVAMGLGASTAYAADGDLDFSFGGGDGLVTTNFHNTSDEARAVAIQPDGKIVAVGTTHITGNDYNFSVARYNPNGSPDTTFSLDGHLTTNLYSYSGRNSNDVAHAVVIQSDGKIVVVGTAVLYFGPDDPPQYDFAIVRYMPDGALDTTFHWDGIHFFYFDYNNINVARAVAIQPDGKIVMAGYTADETGDPTDFALARLNTDGFHDNSFSGDGFVTTNFFGGVDEVRAVALQAGRIVVAGNAQVSGFNYDFALARFDPDGSLDNTFAGDGKTTVDFFGGDDGAFAMALQPDGKIVAAGGAFYEPSSYNFAVARLLSDGSLDAGFGVGGIKVEDLGGGGIDNANAVVIQPDGKIVLAGFAPVGGVNRFALARFTTTGFLDASFGGGDGWLTTDFGGGSGETRANGIAIQSDNRIVVVGTADMGSTNYYDYALARYLSGLEPPPTPTNTPVPTQTPGGPTATPQATPTTCPMQFPDVPPGSTFYDFVRCLACRGIVSGYPDGTFGPGNPVTRGQLSKIVSNSAGYWENQTNQTFEDVPTGSTFHQFIERLSSRGHISGYACGGAGEPCVPPGNRPYFRPNANVTRGQTSKIVASARGLPAPPPGLWTFQDVPQGSTFWEWIESLSSAGAITGYPCGGAGEPCLPPENRYYFRPNNQVTRGQSAKIVANAFFPGCQTP